MVRKQHIDHSRILYFLITFYPVCMRFFLSPVMSFFPYLGFRTVFPSITRRFLPVDICGLPFCHFIVSKPLPLASFKHSELRTLGTAVLFQFSLSRKDGFLVTTFPFGIFPHTQTGKSGGQVHGCSFLRNAFFTIRSSSEWKVMIQSLPPGFRKSIISSRESRSTSSSRFSSIRIA